MKRFVIVLILLAAAFAGGYIPGYLKIQEAERQTEELRQSLQHQEAESRKWLHLLTLQNELGTAMIEADQKNFGRAQEDATRFFDAVTRAIADTDDEGVKEKLTAISRRRDEITSELSSLNPDAVMKLQKLYLDLSQATGAR